MRSRGNVSFMGGRGFQQGGYSGFQRTFKAYIINKNITDKALLIQEGLKVSCDRIVWVFHPGLVHWAGSSQKALLSLDTLL